jgi:hypothetical protein
VLELRFHVLEDDRFDDGGLRIEESIEKPDAHLRLRRDPVDSARLKPQCAKATLSGLQDLSSADLRILSASLGHY